MIITKGFNITEMNLNIITMDFKSQNLYNLNSGISLNVKLDMEQTIH